MRLFQYWDTGEPPDDVAAWVEGFRIMNPDMKHRLYDRDTASWLIGKHVGRRERRAFDSLLVPSMQSDYFRVCAAFRFGGAYADADFQCLRPLAPLLRSAPGGLMTLTDGQIVHSLMFVPAPENAFLEACMRLCTCNIEARDIDNAFTATGPGVPSALWAILDPAEGRRLVERFENPLQCDWMFSAVVERARREIRDTPALARAFDALTLLPKRELLTWIGKTDPPYKQTQRHWLHWRGSVYADGDAAG